jgi:hypothetical protein
MKKKERRGEGEKGEGRREGLAPRPCPLSLIAYPLSLFT